MHSASKTSDLPPPNGYESWLEFAVDTLNVRKVEMLRLFKDDVYVSRDEVKMAVWTELNDLRERAGLH